jgi:prophage regulatory protein
MQANDDQYLRIPAVVAKVGLSRTEIYRRIAAGVFPRQKQLGPRSVAWSKRDLEAWMSDVNN